MTKDEAIEVLRTVAEISPEARAILLVALEAPTSEAVAWKILDASDVEVLCTVYSKEATKHYAALGHKIEPLFAAPVLDAVGVEKPQQDNAVRPSAEPAGQHGASIAAKDQAMVDLMPKRAAFLAWAKSRALDVSEDRDAWGERKFQHSHVQALWDGWFNAPATYATPEQPSIAGAANGGNTKGVVDQHKSLSNQPLESNPLTQNAEVVDPAPTDAGNAGTIDTAEFKALLVECHYNVTRSDKWGPLISHIDVRLNADRLEGSYFPHKVVVPEGWMVVMENGKVIDPAAAPPVPPVVQSSCIPPSRAEPASQQNTGLIGEILALAETGMCHGLTADDYCSRIVEKIKVARLDATSRCRAQGGITSGKATEIAPTPTDAGIPISDEREGFEAWYTQNYTSWIPRSLLDADEYGNMNTQMAWKAWQARGQQQAGVADVLFDGNAVYAEITRKHGKSHCFSPDAVSATLDAAVRLIRASVPGEA